MKQAYFVTGTDTGVGKTTVSCKLLQAYAAQGRKVVGMKPVASGCERIEGKLVSGDVRLLRAAGNIQAPLNTINPYAFEPPLAPYIAAAQVGTEIRLSTIVEAFRVLQSMADVVIVEGVGGFRVPLNAQQDTADLAVALELPVILVVGMRLGCINHALLTAEAIRHRGLPLAGWVANRMGPGIAAFEENLATLDALLVAPCLAVVDYQKDAEMHEILPLPDIVLPQIRQ
jgi:dethiobiotin synthetase